MTRIIYPSACAFGLACLVALLQACTGSSPERPPDAPLRGTTPALVPRADTTGAPAVAPLARGSQLWRYTLKNGWLSELDGYDRNDPEADSKEYAVEHRAECRGLAVVRRCATGDCWTWSVSEQKCTGTGKPARVDWLNADDSQSLRKLDGRWTLSPSLIGRGECGAEPSFDGGELVRLVFTCEWKCSPGDPCEGGAEYEFIRDSTHVRR